MYNKLTKTELKDWMTLTHHSVIIKLMAYSNSALFPTYYCLSNALQ